MTDSSLDGAEEVYVNGTDVRDVHLAKMITEVLLQKYPGWLWMVGVNMRHGLIDITNAQLDSQFAYVIKLSGLFSWDSLRDASIRAGGEILERYEMQRGMCREDDYRALKVSPRGVPIGDVLDALPDGKKKAH